MKRVSLLLAAILVTTAAAFGQERVSYHTQLYDHLDPVAPANGIRYSALIGYAAPDGREYAILGGVDGTYVIDVTESPIRLVSYIPGIRSIWREMKTYRTYAYVVSEGNGDLTNPPGLQIIDLSKLPNVATLVRTDTSLFGTAHTIECQGNYLYINGTGAGAHANGGTIAYSLADPLHPQRLGTWSTHYVHDCMVRNDTLFAAAINDGLLDIVYLGSDRTAMSPIAEVRYPGGGTHNVDLTADGSYAMTTDEIGTTPKTLKVWDIRDMQDISKAADYTPVPGQIIHNVHVKGDLAFVAWYTAGTRILDIGDPLHPVQIGFYDTYQGAGATMNGNWETYPYLPSGKILASDMQSGLYVFTFDRVRRASISGFVREEGTGTPIPNATIILPDFEDTLKSDADGRYTVAAGPDTIGFVAAVFGYYTRSGSMVLTEGGATQDIMMRPLQYASLTLRAVDSITGAPIPTFAWRVMNRGLEGLSADIASGLRVVSDSSYDLYVGAWGYLPKLVTVALQDNGSMDVPLARGYADDVELDLGWSLAATGDSARRGLWERGVPVVTRVGFRTIQPATDVTAGTGDRAFITGIAGSISNDANSSCVIGGQTTLTTPMMDLSTYADPTIRCALWYVNDGNAWVDDTLQLLISNDDGSSWRTLREIPASLKGWQVLTLPLRDVIAPTATMLFRVVASERIGDTALFNSIVEAGLDDFQVIERPASAVSVEAAPGGGNGLVVSVRPNPVTGAAWLDLDLAAPHRRVTVELFDLLGRRVALLLDGPASEGAASARLDGSQLAPGCYIWRALLDDGTARSGAVTIVH